MRVLCIITGLTMGVTFDSINIGITRHAMDRFKLRIDPTATQEQVIGYVRQSIPSERIRGEMFHYGYTTFDMLRMYKKLVFKYLHVSFVVAVRRGKGKGVEVVTCF